MKKLLLFISLALFATAPLQAQNISSISFGNAQAATPYKNLFGWTVGHVDVAWTYACFDCTCSFVGAPTLSETLPIQSCSIVSISSTPVSCGATKECPDGVWGQSVRLVIECCIPGVDIFGALCVSHQETLVACP